MENLTINILLITALLVVLAVQLIVLINKPAQKRKPLKIVLNILFWLSLVLLVFPPSYTKNNDAKNILIIEDDVASELVNKLSDSLKINIVKNTTEIKEALSENSDYINSFSDVFFLGRKFQNDFLSNFSGFKTTFIPYFKPNELNALHYRGIIKETENQVIKGSVFLDKKSTLKITFGTETIDSLILNKGNQNFEFKVSTFSLGKTKLDLELNNKAIGSINYYVEPSRKLNVLILLPYPNFEGNSLANLLASKGHTVTIQTTIAKNQNQKIEINKSAENKDFDLVICTPAEIGFSAVTKSLRDDGRLLIFGLENVQVDIRAINKKIGTNFLAKKTSNEEEILLSNNVSKLPFEFEKTYSTLIDNKLPIAYDRKGVSISLLAETFPLKLSGDSITYTKTWNSVLNSLNFSQENNIQVYGPLGAATNTRIAFNNFKEINKVLIADDTVGVFLSAINNKTAFGNYTFRTPGWQKLGDSQLYIEDSTNTLASTSRIKQYLAKNKTDISEAGKTSSREKLFKPWLLWTLCLLLYFVLWVEPKL